MQRQSELRGEVRAGHVEMSGMSQMHELRSGEKMKRRAHSGGCDDKDNKIVIASMY